jgi:peptidoglycan hydrolase-like protein with peptidoglycan-binding domain
MAAAGHGGLDPRQVKAREEFQRMREQLRRSLERPSDPAPWRERTPSDIASLRRVAERSHVRVRAHPRRIKWSRAAVIAAGAFAAGLVTALIISFVLLRGPGDAAAELRTAAADPEVPPVSAPAPTLRPAPVETAAAPRAEPVRTSPPPAAAADEPEVLLASVVQPVVESTPAAAIVEEPVATGSAVAETAPVAQPEPDAAQARVAARLAPAATSAAGDADLATVRINRVREAQALLMGLGYGVNRADGDAGPQTLTALSTFAADHELSDVNLDAALLAGLRAAQAGALATPGARDTDDVVLARVTRVRDAQALLSALGYEPGRADGDAGPRTLEAAAAFAALHGLEDANLDEAFLALLREDTVRPR